MALTTKKRPDVNHKKVNARHHRHSKTYVKTYWPYIPILFIVVTGFLINGIWHHKTVYQPRMSSYSYYNILESSIGLMALAIFLLRHAFAWHKVFVKGEAFVAKHPLLDIGLVGVATLGMVLSSQGIVLI